MLIKKLCHDSNFHIFPIAIKTMNETDRNSDRAASYKRERFIHDDILFFFHDKLVSALFKFYN